MTRGIQLLFLNVRVFTRLNLNVKEIGLSTVVGRVHYRTWLQKHSRSISLAELSTLVYLINVQDGIKCAGWKNGQNLRILGI